LDSEFRRLRIALLFEFIFELPQLAFSITTGLPGNADAAAADFSSWLAIARDGLVALDA
jgi:hypothetical protein